MEPRRLDALGSLTLSAISYLEVLQGIRNKSELAVLKQMLQYRHAVLTANLKHFTAVPGLRVEAFSLA